MHLTIRVPWHDSKWNGRVCNSPFLNSYCIDLERIREGKDYEKEELFSGKSWSELKVNELPACIAESGGFMNDNEWIRLFFHPYKDIEATSNTHGHLMNTPLKVPEYSTFAVPFAWMLRSNQVGIDSGLPLPLTPDTDSQFPSPWVFSRERQIELLNLFFGKIQKEKSLVFFYTKSGHPLGENIKRLIVGVGRVTNIGKLGFYDTEHKESYPFWDRNISHSIRQDGSDGFLLPYHEYLETTGDEEEDKRREKLLSEIIVEAEPEQIRSFSYGAELAGGDVCLSTLVRCLYSVRKIREHGIISGPWDKREEWLNDQISKVWESRGTFPGIGAALETLGMRLGTSFYLELLSSGAITKDENPWVIVDSIIKCHKKPPQSVYKGDLAAIKNTWIKLSEDYKDRLELLKLLSRFDLTTKQMKRWFLHENRNKITTVNVSDSQILANPYIISENDLGEIDDQKISLSTIDKGLLPDATIAAKFPVPYPSRIDSQIDQRRARAIIVSILKQAAENGDTLLSVVELLENIEKSLLYPPCNISNDWIDANKGFLDGVVETVEVNFNPETGEKLVGVQLTEINKREKRLSKILRARSEKEIEKLSTEWSNLIIDSIKESGGNFDEGNERHIEALNEQCQALTKITSKKLSVLIGRAGTGKTSVLGALLKCEELVKEGVLLLAPTGKARVRLGNATNAEAMTVAQFLYKLGRYDVLCQIPLFKGRDKYRKEKTVIIDECSMLNMDDLLAVFEALDLAHVKRVILVGDPNQLPPIGAGRPFTDFVISLEKVSQSNYDKQKAYGEALARLNVEVRALTGGPSDTLRLASWYTRELQPVDSDRVLGELEFGANFNDLEVCFWKNPDELRNKLLEQFQKQMSLNSTDDIQGFNRALGINNQGYVDFSNPNIVEQFQILSPVRSHPYGVQDINRWVQQHFRKKELLEARKPWGIGLGDEEIVIRDKVIQVKNQKRSGYNNITGASEDVYLANGEIGVLTSSKNRYLNGIFARRPGITVGYSKKDFPLGNGSLELAYALTVHKSQGSEFKTVFVVIPKNSRLLSREMIYTALTRSRNRMVLLIEGENATTLYELTKPELSETARRNTNLFEGIVRERKDVIPYAEHLIHKTEKGHLVRSKSELVIANMLFHMGIEYEYERLLEFKNTKTTLRPDFSFIDASGELIIWEHLGMLNRDDYRKGWEWKKEWYSNHEFIEGENLFTTYDDENGGLNSEEVRRIAEEIQDLI